jgi:hypothetical protein
LKKIRDHQSLTPEERLEKRQAILDALIQVTEDSQTIAERNIRADNLSNEYYTLTQEEIEGLLSGDMGKIKSWVSKLDRSHAAWLLRRLIKDSW